MVDDVDTARIDTAPIDTGRIDTGRIDTARIADAVSELLAAIGEDPHRAGLVDTPRRVADAYHEFFGGVGVDAGACLGDPMPAESASGNLVMMGDIEFRSMCEHHLLPFFGTATIAYVPSGSIVGLGRLPALVDVIASRPQLQERLTNEVADALDSRLTPAGVLVHIEATHQCVSARGARQTGTSTVTMAARGSLADPAARAEVIALIGAASTRDPRPAATPGGRAANPRGDS